MKGADRVAALLDELKPGNRLADKRGANKLFMCGTYTS